jgi:hypothetical protein
MKSLLAPFAHREPGEIASDADLEARVVDFGAKRLLGER